MAAQRGRTVVRPKIKQEVIDSNYAGAASQETEFDCASVHLARVKQSARMLATDVGFGSLGTGGRRSMRKSAGRDKG